MTGWVFPECDLCSEMAGTHVLRLPHPDAPGGETFIRECKGCGLKRLWPRPGPDIIQNYYGSDYGAYLGRQRSPLKQVLWDLWRDGASGAPGRGKTLRKLFPFFQTLGDYLFDINISLDRKAPLRILDIGCGFGDLLLYWQSRGAKVLGIDFDIRAAEVAKKLHVTVIHGNPLDQDLVTGSFDVAALNHSLEHLTSPLAVLQKAYILLKPHGELHVAVPNIASGGFYFLRQNWEGISFPVHFWFFEPHSILQLLRMAGFQDIKLMTRYPQQWFFSRIKYLNNVSQLKIFLTIMGYHITRPYGGDVLKTIAFSKR
jgi:SAM-dependent methyltransferase